MSGPACGLRRQECRRWSTWRKRTWRGAWSSAARASSAWERDWPITIPTAIISAASKNHLLPAFDRAFSTLITDLDDRGLLSTTLVVAMTEFGRTPRINALGGRDHHSRAWSIVLAGAGLPGGRVLGATDRTGTEVTDLPVSPEDLLRTICSVLNIRPEADRMAGRVVAPVLA